MTQMNITLAETNPADGSTKSSGDADANRNYARADYASPCYVSPGDASAVPASSIDATIYFALAAGGFMVAAATGSAAVQAAALAALAAGASTFVELVTPLVGPRQLQRLFATHVAPILLFALGSGLAAGDGFDRFISTTSPTLPDWVTVALVFGSLAAAIVAVDSAGNTTDNTAGTETFGYSAAAKRSREAMSVAVAALLATAILFGAPDHYLAIAISLVMAGLAALTAIELKSILRMADQQPKMPLARETQQF